MNKEKITKKIKIGIITGVLLVSATTLVLLHSPKQKKEAENKINPPEIVQNGKVIEYQDYNEIKELAHKDDKKNEVKTENVKLTFGAPKLIARPRFLKIPPGTMVQGKLLSGGSNGTVRAQLTESISTNGEGVPIGTILLGTGQSNKDRLFVKFSQMLFSDGSFEKISADAADFEDKTAGIKGSLIGYYAKKIGSSATLNFIAGVSAGLQENEVINGMVVKKSNMKTALLSGTRQAALAEANETLSEYKSNSPVISINSGTKIYIIFTGE